MSLDYSAHVEESPDSNALSQLRELVDQLRSANDLVSDLKEQLAEAQRAQRELSEVILPDFLEEHGFEEVKLSDGRRVGLKVSVHASIPKSELPAALRWLDAHGHGDLVKRTLTLRFGKDSEEEVREISEELARELGLPIELGGRVEPMTLKAWAREMLETGQEVPAELFGVYRRRVAVVESKSSGKKSK